MVLILLLFQLLKPLHLKRLTLQCIIVPSWGGIIQCLLLTISVNNGENDDCPPKQKIPKENHHNVFFSDRAMSENYVACNHLMQSFLVQHLHN